MELLKQNTDVSRTRVLKLINGIDTALEIETTENEILHTFLGRLASLQLQLHEVQSAMERSASEEEAEAEFYRAFEYNDRIVTYVSKLKYRLERRGQVTL